MSSCVVKDVVRTVLHVPFHERCADTMEVYGPGWSIVELIEVETEGGVVGIGETIQGYTWGHSREAEFAACAAGMCLRCCGTIRWELACRWRCSTRPVST